MKGAILSVNPGAAIIDITHGISPGDITEGALVMLDACPFFPEGTIHVGVVDPGVGGGRRALLVESERYFFIGPDNGLLSPAVECGGRFKRVFRLENKKYFLKEISDTFHGRDVFGPAAGHLSLGVEAGAFGPPLENFLKLKLPGPAVKGSGLVGEVIHVDTFGNLITNIKREDILNKPGSETLLVRIKGAEVKGILKTYSEIAEGGLGVVIGGSGRMEVAAKGASAGALLGCGVGEKVSVNLPE